MVGSRSSHAELRPQSSGGDSAELRGAALHPARLPRDVLERASVRLAVASLTCAVVFLLAFPVMNFAPPAAGDLQVANAVAAANVVLSLAVFGLTRARLSAERLLDLGLVYEVLLGFGLSLAELYATYEPQGAVRGVSWVALWIVAFPAVVPSTTGKTLLAALATATTGPVAILIAIATGTDAPSARGFAYMVTPNYIAAGLALVLSGTLYRLGRDVRRARQMGSYRLVELLGSGGMGEVWRAEHRMLARPAAIKLVMPSALGAKESDGATALKRFEREAKATAQLTSIHTIELYDFGVTSDGALYYVMELLEGTDVDTLIRRHGAVPPERAVHLLLQVCESLAEAHADGLIHRDIKPANLYLCRLGTVYDCIKVLDFGLVAVTGPHAEHATRLTADGTVTGTPAFMAPEVATGEHPVDERVDIYALGCVAYWLVTGKLVFEGKTPVQMVYEHTSKQPLPPSQRTEQWVPEALDRVVLDCLAKDPARRPASALELAARLRACDLPPWSEEQARSWWQSHPDGQARDDDPRDSAAASPA